MTEEEYLRMKNILDAIIEQQASLSEIQANADARIARNAEAIAALLTIAQMHEQEITNTNERLNTKFEEVAVRFQEIATKSAETDDRINALLNVVERYISKN